MWPQGVVRGAIFQPQEFYADLLDQPDFITSRRALLKKRAGIRQKDGKVAGPNRIING